MSCKNTIIREASYNQIQHIEQAKLVRLDTHVIFKLFEGAEINLDAVERAVRGLVLRHESLRTCFQEMDGRIKQIIFPDSKNDFLQVHLDDGAEEFSDKARALYERELLDISRIEELPLAKFLLVFLENSKVFTLYVLIHHVISDAWSMGLLKEEFGILYRAICMNVEPKFGKSFMQLKEYCALQNSTIDSCKEQISSYWKNKVGRYQARSKLADFHKGYELRTGNRIELIPPGAYALDEFLHMLDAEDACSYSTYLEEDLFLRVKAVAHRVPCLISIYMYAGLAILMHLYTQQSEILFASPMADRWDANKRSVIGNLMGGIYIPIKFNDEMKINEVISIVAENFMGGVTKIIFNHEAIGLNEPELRSRSDVYINYISSPTIQLNPGTEADHKKHVAHKNSYYPLNCIINEYRNALQINWRYNSLLLPSVAIEDLASCYMMLIEIMVSRGSSTLSDLSKSLLNGSSV